MKPVNIKRQTHQRRQVGHSAIINPERNMKTVFSLDSKLCFCCFWCAEAEPTVHRYSGNDTYMHNKTMNPPLSAATL